jgi:RHS repeat-associated protein
MTDQGAAVVWAADYLPFGTADVSVGSVDNNLRFAGQYYDSETGLHYNWNRYYDPSLGRYLRADPIGVIPNSLLFTKLRFLKIIPDINHLYSYAKNNPIGFIDPYGLCPKINHKVKVTYIDQSDGKNNNGWAELKCDLIKSEGDCKCPGETKTCTYRCKRRYILIKNSGGQVTHHWEDLGERTYPVSCDN